MNISRLRNIAATLMTLSGISHIAALWLRELDLALVIYVAFGAIYLFIGIGLYGQSRFVLFTAIVFPIIGTTLGLSSHTLASFSALGLGQLGVDIFVIVSCAAVLWAVRNNPSV